jgi:hypothetical protein
MRTAAGELALPTLLREHSGSIGSAVGWIGMLEHDLLEDLVVADPDHGLDVAKSAFVPTDTWGNDRLSAFTPESVS